MDACFEPCGRPGCSHARWNHRSDGPCRAGPDTYECGCESFVEPERNVGEKMVAEALAIAAEETPLEKKLREALAGYVTDHDEVERSSAEAMDWPNPERCRCGCDRCVPARALLEKKP